MRPLFKLLIILALIFTYTSAFANVKTYKVRWGDTLFSLLSDKFSAQEILDISKEIKSLLPDFTLKKGTLIKESATNITLVPNFLTDISISKVDDNVKLDVIQYPVRTVKCLVEGEIESSLVQSVSDQGEDVELAFMIASIYEWEIDFFHALRKGDGFRVLVEKQFARDKFIGYGKILAVDFINQGRFIRALYYESEKTKGYFRPDGTSLKKGFLKVPLKYSRISSGYTSKRLHPVTNKLEPHYGVDYAAPVGTPVYATADGNIRAKGFKKNNGNYLAIKHMNGYETFYLHLSGFKRGLKSGSYVRQGDLIGYVGATGRATGPHLDYRIRKGKTYLNPMNFKAPDKKLPNNEMGDFLVFTAQYESKIDDTYAYESGNRLVMMR